MNFHRRGVVFLLLLSLTASSGAQDNAPRGKGTPAARVQERPIVEQDVAIKNLRDSNPTTPEQLARAARIAMDLSRFDEAAVYLGKLVELKLDDSSLAVLRAKMGSDLFLRVTVAEELERPLRGFGSAVLDASYRQARDPARVDGLIGRLSAASVQERAAATAEISLAGRAAVVPLLNVLQNSAREQEHSAVRNMLIRIGKDAVEPLIGVLGSADEALRAQVMDVLGRVDSSRAVPYLLRSSFSSGEASKERQAASAALRRILGELPTKQDAEEFLRKNVRTLLDQEESPLPLDNEGIGEIWLWNSATRRPVAHRADRQEIALLEAARVAEELRLLSPENPAHRRLYLATQLEAAQLMIGLDEMLSENSGSVLAEATAAGADVMMEVLGDCLRSRRNIGALAALRVLSTIATPTSLETDDGRPSLLASCLQHADRRVRVAAATSILRINPIRPFSGASMVTDVMNQIVGTVGTQRALVVHPLASDGQSLVGMLNERGYSADAVTTGRAAFGLAIKQADYEFMLISDVVEQPRIGELLQMLRQEPRIGRMPICVLTRAEQLEKLQRSTEFDAQTLPFVRPYELESLDLIVHKMRDISKRELVSQDERIRQAGDFLTWISRLNESPGTYEFYELRKLQTVVEMAMRTDELTTKAVEVLGQFGTPQAQQALVNFASEPSWPLEHRKQAAAALATAIKNHSILLTQDSILEQYRRYNSSSTLDADSQQVLSRILDILEQRADTTAEPEAELQKSIVPNR